jgi:hypothetical protein
MKLMDPDSQQTGIVANAALPGAVQNVSEEAAVLWNILPAVTIWLLFEHARVSQKISLHDV